ncbi:hypothetical protein BD410DRAFT_369506 [Rickenella mellea]|uniref:Uncharacterized protein n=1 Tax=Rickenella mellea TaxID=50990 RepID=A0A4Y7PZC8_9AGAM|nr:hypothetical protein BD410DRAFT_369506 [Rickenella mellea]
MHTMSALIFQRPSPPLSLAHCQPRRYSTALRECVNLSPARTARWHRCTHTVDNHSRDHKHLRHLASPFADSLLLLINRSYHVTYLITLVAFSLTCSMHTITSRSFHSRVTPSPASPLRLLPPIDAIAQLFRLTYWCLNFATIRTPVTLISHAIALTNSCRSEVHPTMCAWYLSITVIFVPLCTD